LGGPPESSWQLSMLSDDTTFLFFIFYFLFFIFFYLFYIFLFCILCFLFCILYFIVIVYFNFIFIDTIFPFIFGDSPLGKEKEGARSKGLAGTAQESRGVYGVSSEVKQRGEGEG
jgi:hypothetical protein